MPGKKKKKKKSEKCQKRVLCFRHLSESRFLHDALYRRSKFANFCHDLMCNGIVYIYHFYSLAVEAGFYGDTGRVIGFFTKLSNGDHG